MQEKNRREQSSSDVQDHYFFPFIIFPARLWWESLSAPPWGYVWHWGKIHTKKRWSLLRTQPSQGWATGLWRSLARPPLWLFEARNPPGLYNSAPARQKQETMFETSKIVAPKMQKHVVEELTCPKWIRAASKPPTWSLFLKRSKGYVSVLLIIPAPLPQRRLLRFPWRGT